MIFFSLMNVQLFQHHLLKRNLFSIKWSLLYCQSICLGEFLVGLLRSIDLYSLFSCQYQCLDYCGFILSIEIKTCVSYIFVLLHILLDTLGLLPFYIYFILFFPIYILKSIHSLLQNNSEFYPFLHIYTMYV